MGRSDPFSKELMLGLEASEELVTRIVRGNDGYPPYNIERLPGNGATMPDRLRITLAVAGFDESELDVSIQANQLLVKGRQAERPEADYLFRGIAARQFQRLFLLADGMLVQSATLRHGLLSIDLIQPEVQRAIRKINISVPQ